METIISFTRNTTLQNILFDEFFAEYTLIEVVSFNYDGDGTALCLCDDQLVEIKRDNLRKIIFGADMTILEAYLMSIFDPEIEDEGVQRQNGRPVFRLPELQNMKKYDVDNLAKQTLQELQSLEMQTFQYYMNAAAAPVETDSGCC
ncbi:MAG: hypothetical protein PHI06_11600 [Desulfobulbaceae bacterium]|nr:hypothetical protein [Desulfobulbaceae bacterium]